MVASLTPPASSSLVSVMKHDGSPLDTNLLSSTTVKTATPRGMLSQHRMKNFLSCSRASEKTHSDFIEHNLDLQWHLKPDYESISFQNSMYGPVEELCLAPGS